MTAYASGGTNMSELEDEVDISGLDSTQLKARKLSHKLRLEQAREILEARQSCRSDVASYLERDRQILAVAKQKKVQVQESLVKAYGSSSSCRSLQAQLTFDLVKYEAERQALADQLKQNEMELYVERSAVGAVRERLRVLAHMKGALVGAASENRSRSKRLSFDSRIESNCDDPSSLEEELGKRSTEAPGLSGGGAGADDNNNNNNNHNHDKEEQGGELAPKGSMQGEADAGADRTGNDAEQNKEDATSAQAPDDRASKAAEDQNGQDSPSGGREIAKVSDQENTNGETAKADFASVSGEASKTEMQTRQPTTETSAPEPQHPTADDLSPANECDKPQLLEKRQDEELRPRPDSMDQMSVSQGGADSCSIASPAASTRQATSPTPPQQGQTSSTSFSHRRSTRRSTRSTASRPSSRADERSVESLQPTLAATLNELSTVEVEYHMRLTERSRLERGIVELERSNQELEATKGRRLAQLKSLTREIGELRQKLAEAHVLFIEAQKNMQILKEEDEKAERSIDYHRASLQAVAWTFDKQLSSMTPSIAEARKQRHKAERLYCQRLEQVKVFSDYTRALVATAKQTAIVAAEAEAEAPHPERSPGDDSAVLGAGDDVNCGEAAVEDPRVGSTSRSLLEGPSAANPAPLLSAQDPVKAALAAAEIRVEWPAALMPPPARGGEQQTAARNASSPTSSPNFSAASPARLPYSARELGGAKGSPTGSPATSSPCASPLPHAKRSSLAQRGRKPIVLPEPPAAAPPEHAHGPGVGRPARDGAPAQVPVPPPLDLKPPNLRPASASGSPPTGTFH